MAAKQPGSGRARRRSAAQPKAALNARGLRSRERMKRAARDVLNEKGYRNIRIQDVTERAGVANGLFYHYFRDLREVVAEVSSDFFDALVGDPEALAEFEDPYDWIFENHRNVVERFSRNPGILACLFGLAGDYDEFDRIWKKNAHIWNLQVADFLQRTANFRKDNARGVAFMLGAMTEGVIYQALIRRTEDLAEFAQQPEDIAEAIAVMWYRMIFLRDPPPGKVRAPGSRLIGVRQVKRK
jgi:AcrR family transcriptional regulator